MALTEKKIELDFRSRLLDSPLAGGIGGGIYLRGTRPRDSREEDAVVGFTAGLPGDLDSGTVTVNIYVPDIDPWGDGTFTEDRVRTQAIEELAAGWVSRMEAEDPDYCVSLADTIHTTAEPETRQHFVVVRLNYENINEN